jgi:ferrous iron transport protein B
MLACYALGIVAAAGTAFIFKRTLTKGPATSFILELPTYKLPQISQVARQVWTNTKAFLTKAGTVIFCLSVILWAMAYYPRLPEARRQQIVSNARMTDMQSLWSVVERRAIASGSWKQVNGQYQGAMSLSINNLVSSPEGMASPDFSASINGQQITRKDIERETEETIQRAVAAAQSEYSLSGRLGHLMEPAIRPLGYDWKIGIGLVSAFAAREVFVSSMGIVYSVGQVEEGKTADLASAMRADRYASGPRAGQPVWTPLVAVSLLVWFVLAMQCMSTFAIVRRETNGWRWPIFMLVYMNALAYVVALAVYQIGSRIS